MSSIGPVRGSWVIGSKAAASELRRCGVREDVAMAITGHRTGSMFSRYNIVDLGDVSRSIEQREA